MSGSSLKFPQVRINSKLMQFQEQKTAHDDGLVSNPFLQTIGNHHKATKRESSGRGQTESPGAIQDARRLRGPKAEPQGWGEH